jgi:UDPglucose 6-dehydrogenase
MKVGIIGVGVVGGALKTVLEPVAQVACYDKNRPELGTFDKLLNADVIFVSVSTPTLANGNQDKLAVFENMVRLWEAGYQGVVAIKSTVLPGTCEWISKQYGLRVVSNPEFLTAANPLSDMQNQPCVILGGKSEDVAAVQAIYTALNAAIPQLVYTATESEMIKYMHNLFLACKVSFCNEMAEVAALFGASYENVRQGAIAIGQIGAGHTQVPGPDGKTGFGGMCFPKDTAAFLTFAQDHQLPMYLLEGAVVGNRMRRGDA